jgi:hypothetical protein
VQFGEPLAQPFVERGAFRFELVLDRGVLFGRFERLEKTLPPGAALTERERLFGFRFFIRAGGLVRRVRRGLAALALLGILAVLGRRIGLR